MAQSEAHAMPLEKIDVSNPRLFQNDTIGRYFERLREQAPVHYCAESDYGPYWSITRYDDIVSVSSNHRGFISHYEVGGHVLGYDKMFRQHGLDARMFQSTDPPAHTAQRKAITPIVARASVREMEDAIRARCAQILDELPRNEPFDWVERVSIELTTQVLATLFDFPWEERRKLTRWSDVAVTEPGFGIVGSWEERRTELEDCFTRFSQLWQERIASEPSHDLLSLMAHSETTRELTPEEFLGNLINLIVGGNDTTRNSLTGGVLAFHRHPDQLDKLRANPGLLESAVPEIVRWVTPISHMARTAAEDIEVRGQKIRAGDRVAMWYISGNRDESAIDRPEDFVIDRDQPGRHLSFGHGIHHCVGKRLAELQLRLAWEEILKRFRAIEVLGEPERVCSNIIHGFSSLPVRAHAH